MRKIAIAAAAGAVGLLIAAAPASALSTYQIQTDGGANFDGTPNTSQSKSGFSMTTRTSNEDNSSVFNSDGSPNANFGAMNRPQQQQNNLSGDMGWQGTGYYLRPNN